MFYFIQAVIAWTASIVLIDWRRFRSLAPYGILGSYLALFQDRVGEHFHLWLYRDAGPLTLRNGHISMLISISAAPIVAILFVQGLHPQAPWPWRRVLAFTAIGMAPEVAAVRTGRILYGPGWSAGHSFVAYILLWTGFWAFYRWQERTPRRETVR
jgi:hypothetical protein